MTVENSPIDLQQGSKEATVLCVLYAYGEYGFRPDDLSTFTTLSTNNATKALDHLYQKDVVGKTADGYYHALDDTHVAEIAESLQNESFSLGTKIENYPDGIS